MPRLKYADNDLFLSRLQRKILDGSLGFAAGVRFVHKYIASIIAIFSCSFREGMIFIFIASQKTSACAYSIHSLSVYIGDAGCIVLVAVGSCNRAG